MRLRPNTTYRFTLCGEPKSYISSPPPGLAVKLKPRKRFKIMVMPDDDIFFKELDLGMFVIEKIVRALFDGEFRDGQPRFEIKVNDLSGGYMKFYEVRPLYYTRTR